MTPEAFQEFIDAISEAFIRGRFEQWRARVRLPVSFVTAKETVTIATEADLRANFLRHSARFREAGVTEIRRSLRSIEMLDTRQALATYDTDFLNGDTLVYMPYTSSMLISREQDDGWCCTSVLNAMGASPARAPEGMKHHDRTPQKALELYQDHLDTVSKIMMEPEMPGLCDYMTFPAEIGMLDSVITVSNCEESHALMTRFVENMRGLGMTDYIRIAKSARFVSATRIEGWHVTHMLQSGSHLAPPYKVEVVLHLIDGRWCISDSLSQTFSHVTALISPEIIPTKLPNKNF